LQGSGDIAGPKVQLPHCLIYTSRSLITPRLLRTRETEPTATSV
jgi:hypothetical protein